MVAAQHDAMEVHVGGCVVAQELWVAEDEAGAVIVEGIPGEQRQNTEAETCEPEEMCAEFWSVAAALNREIQTVECERERRDDRCFFGEDG